ncbi:MAG: N-acetyltransferase [Phyllobacteriaceae bacterium]|nr:N-acetyltransferase [Phyllobacteriaceae bacterium]
MSASLVTYAPEAPEHDAAIEAINEEAFGPGRFARAAYKIREAGGHDAAFSFVALQDGEVIASVRQTPVVAGKGRALLLGPLAVRPDHKSQGHGRKLVGIALDAARAAGAPAVLLVGDEPYYGPLGFRKVPRGRLTLPRPVDPERLLVCELAEGGAEVLAGEVIHARQTSR